MAVIIGLTGQALSGKTTLAKHLEETQGLTRIHPFASGKQGVKGYLVHLGMSNHIADEMLDGPFKDIPCPYLPLNKETGERYSVRWLEDRMRYHMSTDLGLPWLIGQEMKNSGIDPKRDSLVFDSVVYEADLIREMGGVIISVERNIEETVDRDMADQEIDGLAPNFVFKNNFTSQEEMISAFDAKFSSIYRKDKELQNFDVEP